jgi:hypothetical protein
MNHLDLSNDFYVEWSANLDFSSGEIYHVKKNKHGGSISTGVARFFVTSARIPPEGYHPHQRLDCFVSDAMLVPQPEQLAKLLFEALKDHDIIGEPAWLGWHIAEEKGGAAFGDVYDWE